jgi:hypothetical protein
MWIRAISPLGIFQRSGKKAEPIASSTIKAKSPAENRKKDFRKDLWGFGGVVFSIVKPLGPYWAQSLLDFILL